MIELALAFIGILFLITIMSVGVFFGRKPVSGSCGGLAALEEGESCSICGASPTNPEGCSEKTLTATSSADSSNVHSHAHPHVD